ncbi:MAG: NAD(P)-dependent alcohol dehydrogenase [Acidimicrobiia bacterium]|nr:NAD(P)-dependent alcohol dehydrogenase [Acidimicrobiia bacterium]
MRAVVFSRYGLAGEVLQLGEIDKPRVGADELLIRVRAGAVNLYDWHTMRADPRSVRLVRGLLKPRADGLGADLAGQIEAVGDDVTRFQTGDEVFGQVDGEVPGKPFLELGSFAEYVCVSQDSVALKPANLTFEEAAAVPMAGLAALQGLRDVGRTEAGQSVLINGASGGVGTFAVQIAKSFGAEVTGVGSTKSLDLIRSIGADHTVDDTVDDFASGRHRYDLILDTNGNRSISACRRALVSDGTYVAIGCDVVGGRWLGALPHLLRPVVLSPFVSQKMASLFAKRNHEDLRVLKELVEDGHVVPVIDRTYPLSKVAEAMQYLETGQAQGKIVIIV